MIKIIRLILTILAIFIILIASAVTIGAMIFKRRVSREVTEIFAASPQTNPAVITEADIEALPEPVQRWLRYSGVVGQARVMTVRLKQEGLFRQGVDQAWIPFTAEEYYTTAEPAFVWSATLKPAPFMPIIGRDMYYQGRGNMFIKLFALLTVADVRGAEIDQGTLLRYLNEIMWFPSAALSDYIRWEPVDANAAQATMSYQGVTASAVFYFDENGALTNMVAERYQSLPDGRFSLETWSTPITEYGQLAGLRLPVAGEGVWQLSSGDFSYIKVRVTEIEYNKPAIY